MLFNSFKQRAKFVKSVVAGLVSSPRLQHVLSIPREVSTATREHCTG